MNGQKCQHEWIQSSPQQFTSIFVLLDETLKLFEITLDLLQIR